MSKETKNIVSKDVFSTEGSVEKDSLLPKVEFLKKFKITAKQFNSTKLRWSEIEKIHKAYINSQGFLENTATAILAKFLTSEAKDAGVHSVKYRLKSPDGLIEKVIRKKIENDKKGIKKTFTEKNYTAEITDLIGIRILHVFKDDWFGIHNYILQGIKCQPKEKPKVYFRKGDEKKFISVCKKNGCDTEVHSKGYRSIHYIINPHPPKKIWYVEIQVRTIFEEGWSEVDHKLRYGSKKRTKHPLDNYLLALNRIAGSADEIGSIVKNRQIELRQEESKSGSRNKKK